MRHSVTFVKFGVVGIINTGVDFSLFVLFVRYFNFDPILSNILAYTFAVTNSYLLNRTWTFKSAVTSKNSYIRFIAINSVGLALGTTVIYILRNLMMLEVAKLLSIFASMIWNYFGSRRLVFHGEK